MKNVAIIGAGLSGTIVARALAAKAKVTVFEKSRGVGGRMSTRRADDYQFDHGAPYFEANSPAFIETVANWQANGWVDAWHCRKFHNHAITTTDVYVASPRMNSLAKHIAAGLEVVTQQRVANAQRVGEQWHLFGDEGEKLGQFDWLISSAPPEQAQTLLPSDLGFYSRLAAVQMQPAFCLMLGFREPAELSFDVYQSHDPVVSRIVVNSAKPQREQGFTVVIEATAHWSEQNLEQTTEYVHEELLTRAEAILLQRLINADYQSSHRWRYAVAAQSASQSIEGQSWLDSAACCAVVGDWCFGSTIEDTTLGATALAETLLNSVFR